MYFNLRYAVNFDESEHTSLLVKHRGYDPDTLSKLIKIIQSSNSIGSK